MDSSLAAGSVNSDPPLISDSCAIWYHELIESYHRNSIGRILRTGSSVKASKWGIECEVEVIYLTLVFLRGGKSSVDCDESLNKLAISVA